MSDLPPPTQSLRIALSIQAAIAAVIMIVVAVSGGSVAKALGTAALYFVLVGGWSWFRIWRNGRSEQRGSAEEPPR
jgi:hypothetical protein